MCRSWTGVVCAAVYLPTVTAIPAGRAESDGTSAAAGVIKKETSEQEQGQEQGQQEEQANGGHSPAESGGMIHLRDVGWDSSTAPKGVQQVKAIPPIAHTRQNQTVVHKRNCLC